MKKILAIIVGFIALLFMIAIAKDALFTSADEKFYEQGWYFYDKKEYEMAKFYFERTSKEKYPDIPVILGSLYADLNEYDEAIENLEEILNKRNTVDEEHYAFALNLLGHCYMQKGDYATAKSFFLEAAKSGNPDSRYNLMLIDSLQRIQTVN